MDMGVKKRSMVTMAVNGKIWTICHSALVGGYQE